VLHLKEGANLAEDLDGQIFTLARGGEAGLKPGTTKPRKTSAI
jgi:hypothetical protein